MGSNYQVLVFTCVTNHCPLDHAKKKIVIKQVNEMIWSMYFSLQTKAHMLLFPHTLSQNNKAPLLKYGATSIAGSPPLRFLKYWRSSQTSLIWTPKGQSQVSALQRCPYYRGRECMIFGISGTKRSVHNRDVSISYT